MIKVVLDTNILVSALWTHIGNPSKIVDMFFTDKIYVYYNLKIMEEYQDVLTRPKLNFPSEKISWLLNRIKEKGILINAEKSTISMIDETDRKFYDTAKTAGAILITGNIKHYSGESFIVSPADFIQKQIQR